MQPKINVGWVVGGGWGTASSRLRGYCTANTLGMMKDFNVWLLVDEQSVDSFFEQITGKDVVVFQRVLSDEILVPILGVCKKLGIKTVIDLADFYPEVVKLSEKVDRVTVPNKARKDEFISRGVAFNVDVVPDMLDYGGQIRQPAISAREGEDVKLAWFGTYTNIGVLKNMNGHKGTAITSENVKDRLPNNWEFKQWQYKSFQDDIREHDICVLPQTDIGKSSNKLLSALAAGVPVVASDIPSYHEVAVNLGIQDYLCSTDAEWAWAIEGLRHRKNRLSYMDLIGPVLKANYTDEVRIEEWARLFRRLTS